MARHHRALAVAEAGVRAASMAMSAYSGDRPGRPVLGGCQAASASGVTHTVRLPRCWSALSYSGQLVTL